MYYVQTPNYCFSNVQHFTNTRRSQDASSSMVCLKFLEILAIRQQITVHVLILVYRILLLQCVTNYEPLFWKLYKIAQHMVNSNFAVDT